MSRNEFVDRQILIIGQNPESAKPGGIITHIRTLLGYDCLKSATVFDPGSVHGTTALTGRFPTARVLGNLLHLRSISKSMGYPIVFTNHSITQSALIKLCLTLIALPPRCRRQTLVFYHGGRFEHVKLLRNRIIREVIARILGTARVHLCLSPAEARGFESFFPGLPKMRYDNYSTADVVDPIEIRCKPPLRVLFAGRVDETKGVIELCRAAAELKRRGEGRDFLFTIVGSGPHLEKVEKIVAEDNLADVVVLRGYLSGSKLTAAYKESDVFLLQTSHPEGFPYSVIEALQVAMPIICTRQGILEDLLEDGTNCIRVEERDVESLLGALKRIRDPFLRQRMSETNGNLFLRRLAKPRGEQFYCTLLDDVYENRLG